MIRPNRERPGDLHYHQEEALQELLYQLLYHKCGACRPLFHAHLRTGDHDSLHLQGVDIRRVHVPFRESFDLCKFLATDSRKFSQVTNDSCFVKSSVQATCLTLTAMTVDR